MAIQITQDFSSQISSINSSLSNYVSKASAVSDASLTEAIGNINKTIFHAPLKNSLAILIGTGAITLTRSTTATYIDRYGVLQTASTDEARFEKDGLLIEGQSSNELKHSADLTQSEWVKTNCTAAKDATGLDNQSNSASTLTATAANATCLQSVTVSSGTYTYYVRIKRKTGTGNIYITIDGSTWVDITSNLSTSSWYKYEVTDAMSSQNVGFKIETSGDEIEIDTNQLENKPFATSYIPTTTAAATRNADICYATYAGNAPNIQAGNAFSMAADFKLLASSMSGVTQMNILSVGHTSAPKFNFIYAIGSIGYMRSSGAITSSYTPNNLNRALVTVDSNELCKLYVNGAYITSNTMSLYVSTNPTSSNKIGIGISDDLNSYPMFGHISNVRIWDFALSEQEAKLA